MTSRTMNGGLWVLVTSLCASCGSDFTPYNEVDGFRLLAIAADPPDLVPNGAVTLRALVVNGSAPSYRWSWCPVTLGAETEHACAFSDHELTTPVLGTTSTVSFRLPDDEALEELCEAAARRDAPLTAPRLDCARARPEVFVRLELIDGDKRIVALQPIPIALSSPRNTNPPAATLRAIVDGASTDLDGIALPPGDVTLELDIAADAAEPYEGDDGPTKEILRATWFVEGGETDVQRTAFIPGDSTATFDALRRNTWTLEPTVTSASVFVVLRDDRGGVSWSRATIRGGAR